MFQMGQDKSIFLWNPYFFSGTTLIGNVESALFYPLNWIFFFIKTEKAISIYIYTHFLMAGFFAYLYLKNLGMRKISSLIGGILYSYSGFFVLHIIHLTLIGVAAWFPLTLLFLDKFFKEKYFYYVVLAGLSFGLSCLCCSPFMIYLHILLIIIYFIFQVNFKKLLDLNNFRNFSAFIIVFLFGLSFSAIQIIPMFESSKYSVRTQGLLYDLAKIGSLNLKTLLMFLIPDYFGHPIYNHSYKGSYFFWEECYYVGIFSIILAVLGMLLSRKPKNNFFLFLGAASLIMALGENTPLFPFMYKYLPYLNFFRVPARFAFFSIFSIVYFASLGVEVVLESLNSKDNQKKILKIITVLLLVFLISLPFIIKGAYFPLSLGV
ncbi:MAG: hypothetical protein HYU63_01870, partial [Armatimonadetes bacterium]|nr:hypothetical protein [Armatimonadota bacterium]